VKATSLPPSTLRARQKASTVELILDAVARCLKETSLSALTFPAIAKEAGIGERTIYRYFPTRETLLDAFWAAHMKAVHGPHPRDAESLLRAPREIFSGFDLNPQVTLGLVSTVQGRAIAQRANNCRVAAFRAAVRDAVGDLPEPQATRLCACVQSLLSAGTWLQMREFWGLGGQESGLAVQEAIQVLLAAARRGDTEDIDKH
jgi:AcrR family transcriptional regulator